MKTVWLYQPRWLTWVTANTNDDLPKLIWNWCCICVLGHCMVDALRRSYLYIYMASAWWKDLTWYMCYRLLVNLSRFMQLQAAVCLAFVKNRTTEVEVELDTVICQYVDTGIAWYTRGCVNGLCTWLSQLTHVWMVIVRHNFMSEASSIVDIRIHYESFPASWFIAICAYPS